MNTVLCSQESWARIGQLGTICTAVGIYLSTAPSIFVCFIHNHPQVIPPNTVWKPFTGLAAAKSAAASVNIAWKPFMWHTREYPQWCIRKAALQGLPKDSSMFESLVSSNQA